MFAPTVAQEWPVVQACCSLHMDILSKPSGAEVGQVTSVGVLPQCGLTAAGERCPLRTCPAGEVSPRWDVLHRALRSLNCRGNLGGRVICLE